MAIQMKGDVSAAELPEAGNLRLNLFVELTGDAPSPRVNLRPVGNSNGQLVARVTPLGEENDVNTGLIAAGLATDGCAAELG